jgi:DNA polymerase V
MFCLVDCNSFYASCEQLFRPDLRGKPVIVLSNNDGAVVAQSKEAKQLGITPFAPYFKIQHLVKRHSVHVFSSNYTLYGDISSRVVRTLREYAADIEVYSIDEVFLTPLPLWGDYKTYGTLLKNVIRRDVGIGVGVGFALTKTLAKAANRAAKKIDSLQGVCVLESEVQREWLLKRMAVGEVWGVGRKIAARLESMGIMTAWALANESPKRIRQHFSVVMERTVVELNGISCIELEDQPPAKQQIFSTRSFGEKLTDIEPIKQATAHYIATAAEKLRKSHLVASTLHVFLQTSRFKENPYSESVTIKLPYPTSDTSVLTRFSMLGIEQVFIPGLEYAKSGVGLMELSSKDQLQADLFSSNPVRHGSLEVMDIFDQINKKFGAGTLKTAAEGTDNKWAAKHENRSPRYTTRFSEIPTVVCK